MSRLPLDYILWAGTLIACGTAYHRYSADRPTQPLQHDADTYAVLRVQQPDGDSLTKAVAVITEGNLFRTGRAGVAPDPTLTPAPMQPSQKPQLALRGLVGGPPWDILVEGIPGRQGTTVLRVGEATSGVTVTSVRLGTVIAKGYDTTWTLTLRPISQTPGAHD